MPRRFGYLRGARPPINTYKDFFNSPAAPPKRKFNGKQQIIKRADVEKPSAKRRHKDTYLGDTKMRIKIPAKVTIAILDAEGKDTGKRKKVMGFKVKVKGSGTRKPESDESYKKRLNFNFTSKRYYGRFTRNPKQPGRELELTSVPETTTEKPIPQLTHEQRRLK